MRLDWLIKTETENSFGISTAWFRVGFIIWTQWITRSPEWFGTFTRDDLWPCKKFVTSPISLREQISPQIQRSLFPGSKLWMLWEVIAFMQWHCKYLRSKHPGFNPISVTLFLSSSIYVINEWRGIRKLLLFVDQSDVTTITNADILYNNFWCRRMHCSPLTSYIILASYIFHVPSSTEKVVENWTKRKKIENSRNTS